MLHIAYKTEQKPNWNALSMIIIAIEVVLDLKFQALSTWKYLEIKRNCTEQQMHKNAVRFIINKNEENFF